MDSALARAIPVAQTLILPASWRDYRAVRRLEKVCFGADAWPFPDVLGVLTLPNVVRLKAQAGSEVLGFVAGDLRRADGLGWIATIAVLPDYQRQGLGERLLLECERQLNVPRIRLTVRLGNTPAIRMYEKWGYRRADRWPNYYTGGEDALVLEKQL